MMASVRSRLPPSCCCNRRKAKSASWRSSFWLIGMSATSATSLVTPEVRNTSPMPQIAKLTTRSRSRPLATRLPAALRIVSSIRRWSS